MARRAAVMVVVAAVALLVACGDGGDGDEPVAAERGGSAEPAVTTTTAALTTTTVAAPTTTAGTVPPSEGGDVSIEMTVPDAVGRDLQYAQDTMQAAGFFSLTSHDATGQDRFQVVDRNWTVCDQSPPGGTTADPATRIDFGAVKEDETCPGP